MSHKVYNGILPTNDEILENAPTFEEFAYEVLHTEVQYEDEEQDKKVEKTREIMNKEKELQRQKMSYDSPIEIVKKIQEQYEVDVVNNVIKCVQSYGINVDKDELIKALKYDRQQYEKGYADGIKKLKQEKHKLAEKIFLLLQSRFYAEGTCMGWEYSISQLEFEQIALNNFGVDIKSIDNLEERE